MKTMLLNLGVGDRVRPAGAQEIVKAHLERHRAGAGASSGIAASLPVRRFMNV